MWLINAEPIKKFIVDGLNNKEPNKAFGHDAIEILAEIEYAPNVDAVEVVHSEWFLNGDGSGSCMNCGKRMEIFYDDEGCMKFCPNCAAKMDGGVSDG